MPELLIISADPDLLDAAPRWAAAAGADVRTASDITTTRRFWRSASAVLVGGDLAATVAGAGLSRRDQVLVVAKEPELVWPLAVRLGAVALIDRLDDEAALASVSDALDGRGEACLLAFVGGSGGVGSTTLVAATATLARSRVGEVLALDADPLGCGLDLVLGAEQVAGAHWNELSGTSGHVAAGSLRAALPDHEGVSVLSFGRHNNEMVDGDPAPLVRAAIRGFDVVVADVPRGGLLPLTGPADVGLSTELVARAALTVLVVGDDVCALAAAERSRDQLKDLASSLALVVRTRRGGLGVAEAERTLGLPVVAALGNDRAVARQVDHGLGPGRSRLLRRTAGALLDAVGVES